MIRTKLFIGGLIVVAFCIVSVASASNSHAQDQSNESSEQKIQSTSPLQSSSLGIPAISPTLSSNSSPRFTSADVQAYVSTHPFMGGPPVQGASSTILEVNFITSKEASTLMQGASTGLTDTELVCYVKFHGPFTLKNASVPSGAKPLPPSEIGVEIFDAKTGNLLMWWTP